MSIAIEFNHVGKQYRLGLVSTRTLSHDLNRWWQTTILRKEDPYLRIGEVNDRTSAANHSDYVWALRDIDFKVEQGDVVGIIGKNGAGKSTLLKLLSKVTGPTVGTIRARGRIGALLEVGTGFHQEMTGRENIYMNGAIMGMTKQEITRKLEEIVDFSGCERYIDTPVKRYSSGMTVRLGFAVAAHLDPDILVVDEVLAVGDAEFQKKAIGKMQEVSKGEGRTVLFVSHNMQSIRSLCQHGILLDKGCIVNSGDIEEVLAHYLQNSISELRRYTKITRKYQVPNLNRRIEYVDIRMDNNDIENISTEEPLCFTATIKRNDAHVNKCQFGLVIQDDSGSSVGGGYTVPVNLPNNNSLFEIKLVLRHHQLAKGFYSMVFNISSFDYQSTAFDYDIIANVIRFKVSFIDANHQVPFLVWPLRGKSSYLDTEVSIKDIQ